MSSVTSFIQFEDKVVNGGGIVLEEISTSFDGPLDKNARTSVLAEHRNTISKRIAELKHEGYKKIRIVSKERCPRCNGEGYTYRVVRRY